MRRPLFALLLSAVACSASPPGAAPTAFDPPTSATSAPGSPTLTPSPTAANRRGSGRPVTIAFGGDVHFEGASRSALSGGLDDIAPLLSRADLAIVNLETAITTRGAPEDKEYVFRAPASAFAALRAAGVDVVTAANNHGLDYGRVGLADTLAAARAARFPLVGLGSNAAEAFAPYRVTIRGQRIAVIGASHVVDDHLRVPWSAGDAKPGMAIAYDEARMVAAVRAARATSDTVIVFLHWGEERKQCPIPRQRAMARLLTSAGADVVVGSHAHVLLGTGRLGDALVSYGLGNFVFYARPGVGAQTGVLTVTVTGRDVESYDWAPAVISGGVPRPLRGAAAADALRDWERLRACTGLDP